MKKRAYRNVAFALVVAALFGLVGYKRLSAEELVRGVDWYKANKTERAAVLVECRNNPGELSKTPNCVNASRADSSATWAATGAGIKVAPLTAKQINTPLLSDETCLPENIAKITNKEQQQELSGKCLRRGTYKPSTPRSW